MTVSTCHKISIHLFVTYWFLFLAITSGAAKNAIVVYNGYAIVIALRVICV